MILDIKPLSVNKAWQGKRFKTNDYKNYETEVLYLLPNKINVDLSDKLCISLTFGFKNKSSDIDNPVKLFIDILQKKYGFNDSQIFELNIKKEITKKPFIKWEIKKY